MEDKHVRPPDLFAWQFHLHLHVGAVRGNDGFSQTEKLDALRPAGENRQSSIDPLPRYQLRRPAKFRGKADRHRLLRRGEARVEIIGQERTNLCELRLMAVAAHVQSTGFTVEALCKGD